MVTINIFANYGVLAHEKQTVYTCGCPDSTATYSEEITVEVPDDWKVDHNSYDDIILTSPWNEVYEVNDVLVNQGDNPALKAYRGNNKWYSKPLKIVENA